MRKSSRDGQNCPLIWLICPVLSHETSATSGWVQQQKCMTLDKSDSLRMHNDYSVHAQRQVQPAFFVLTRRNNQKPPLALSCNASYRVMHSSFSLAANLEVASYADALWARQKIG